MSTHLPPLSQPPTSLAAGRQPRRATVRVRRLGFTSLAQAGCLLGGVGWLIPGLLLGVGLSLLVAGVRRWLEGIQQLSFSFLGRELANLNLVQTLGLTPLLNQMRSLDAAGPLTILGVTFTVALVGGLLAMIIVLLLGAAYNLLAAATGGIELELDETTNSRAEVDG